MQETHYKNKSVLEKESFSFFQDSITRLLIGTRKTHPSYSIVIPTFKRNQTLYEALKSAIEQKTDIEYEVLVLDNNDDNNDNTTYSMLKEKFSNADFCYYKNTRNIGMTGNWNLGIQLAKGKYIVILHDDDRLHENYLACINQVLSANPDIGLISCWHNEFVNEGISLMESDGTKNMTEISYRDETIKSSFLHHTVHVCGLCFSREKAISIGGFDDYWYPASDYVFEIKIMTKFGGVLCKHKLADYRILENESLKSGVAGRFPILVYIGQDALNREYHMFPKAIAKKYMSTYLTRYEDNLIQQFCKNSEEIDKLKSEFSNWRILFNIPNENNLGRIIFKCLNIYLCFIHIVHTHKIRKRQGLYYAKRIYYSE